MCSTSTPRRQGDRPGFSRVFEIVDVAPVVRHLAIRRPGFEKPAHKRVASAAGRAQNIDVMAVDIDSGTELNGFGSPLLARYDFQWVQVRRRIEVELRGVAAPVKQPG
jgi:hypothetical protein